MIKSKNRRAALGLLVAGVLAPATASAQEGPLSGLYNAQGMNQDGSKYGGTVEITHLGSAVTMKWSIGTDTFQGAGSLEGRVVTINWGGDDPVVYVVMDDGALHGTWADGLALEKLTRQ